MLVNHVPPLLSLSQGGRDDEQMTDAVNRASCVFPPIPDGEHPIPFNLLGGIFSLFVFFGINMAFEAVFGHVSSSIRIPPGLGDSSDFKAKWINSSCDLRCLHPDFIANAEKETQLAEQRSRQELLLALAAAHLFSYRPDDCKDYCCKCAFDLPFPTVFLHLADPSTKLYKFFSPHMRSLRGETEMYLRTFFAPIGGQCAMRHTAYIRDLAEGHHGGQHHHHQQVVSRNPASSAGGVGSSSHEYKRSKTIKQAKVAEIFGPKLAWATQLVKAYGLFGPGPVFTFPQLEALFSDVDFIVSAYGDNPGAIALYLLLCPERHAELLEKLPGENQRRITERRSAVKLPDAAEVAKVVAETMEYGRELVEAARVLLSHLASLAFVASLPRPSSAAPEPSLNISANASSGNGGPCIAHRWFPYPNHEPYQLAASGRHTNLSNLADVHAAMRLWWDVAKSNQSSSQGRLGGYRYYFVSIAEKPTSEHLIQKAERNRQARAEGFGAFGCFLRPQDGTYAVCSLDVNAVRNAPLGTPMLPDRGKDAPIVSEQTHFGHIPFFLAEHSLSRFSPHYQRDRSTSLVHGCPYVTNVTLFDTTQSMIRFNDVMKRAAEKYPAGGRYDHVVSQAMHVFKFDPTFSLLQRSVVDDVMLRGVGSVAASFFVATPPGHVILHMLHELKCPSRDEVALVAQHGLVPKFHGDPETYYTPEYVAALTLARRRASVVSAAPPTEGGGGAKSDTASSLPAPAAPPLARVTYYVPLSCAPRAGQPPRSMMHDERTLVVAYVLLDVVEFVQSLQAVPTVTYRVTSAESKKGWKLPMSFDAAQLLRGGGDDALPWSPSSASFSSFASVGAASFVSAAATAPSNPNSAVGAPPPADDGSVGTSQHVSPGAGNKDGDPGLAASRPTHGSSDAGSQRLPRQWSSSASTPSSSATAPAEQPACGIDHQTAPATPPVQDVAEGSALRRSAVGDSGRCSPLTPPAAPSNHVEVPDVNGSSAASAGPPLIGSPIPVVSLTTPGAASEELPNSGGNQFAASTSASFAPDSAGAALAALPPAPAIPLYARWMLSPPGIAGAAAGSSAAGGASAAAAESTNAAASTSVPLPSAAAVVWDLLLVSRPEMVIAIMAVSAATM